MNLGILNDLFGTKKNDIEGNDNRFEYELSRIDVHYTGLIQHRR